MKRIAALILAVILFLNLLLYTSCMPSICTKHEDVDNDGICDSCSAELDVDPTPDPEPEPEPEPPLLPDDVIRAEKYIGYKVSSTKIRTAINVATSKVNQLHGFVGEGYPSAYAKNGAYSVSSNKAGWTQGFWSGILWHTYDITADSSYKDAALSQVDSFYTRIAERLGTDNHDMGFLYTLSCMSAYKETGDLKAKEALLLAADQLMERYHEDVGFIQAWGTMGDEAEYRLIIDTFMNLPLLYYATELTGDDKYAEAAYTHYKTAVSVIYREDGGSYHTYFFDKETGKPAYGKTKQGNSDESTWSRGQAWGMYGALLTYIYTGDESCLDTFKMATNYFLNHLPEDDVAYWDFTFTTGSTEARDSSATAIAVCALLESLKHLDESDPYYAVYEGAANRIMEALIDTCSTAGTDSIGLMLHGTGSKTSAIDTMTIYGDYFYMEALHRFIEPDWELYW